MDNLTKEIDKEKEKKETLKRYEEEFKLKYSNYRKTMPTYKDAILYGGSEYIDK